MKSMSNATRLKWVQPMWARRQWQLYANDQQIGALEFGRLFSQTAEFICGDDRWTIQRMGFFRRTIRIMMPQTAVPVADVAPRWTGREATITLSDGREYIWTTLNFWATRYELRDPQTDSPIITYRLGLDRERFWDGFKTQARMMVEAWTLSASELILLNAIGWFLIIVTREDASAAASAGGAA